MTKDVFGKEFLKSFPASVLQRLVCLHWLLSSQWRKSSESICQKLLLSLLPEKMFPSRLSLRQIDVITVSEDEDEINV